METAPLLRADLYQALAEALAEPPEWLALAGDDWPLTAVARNLVGSSTAMDDAVARLVEIPAESLAARRRRYAALSAGPGRPQLWFYESAQREGRLLGQVTLAVARLYQAAGLELAGAELPDHASVELAFLAFLVRRQASEPEHGRAWRQLERRFIKEHGGHWLPALGHGLDSSGDPVYAPIGRLLAYWLAERARPSRRKPALAQRGAPPLMARPEDCTLCGFCVGVCPTRAMAIHETGNETMLLLHDGRCTGCGKCVGICQATALEPGVRNRAAAASWRPLRRSPRATCPACGAATVSCAELDFVARQIGQPDWLVYCLSCRSYPMERSW
jgi:TorA maturation chaperone TorD/Pyruvate/2-oxoacid:ferredoxin oxidoreductase delta subunit